MSAQLVGTMVVGVEAVGTKWLAQLVEAVLACHVVIPISRLSVLSGASPLPRLLAPAVLRMRHEVSISHEEGERRVRIGDLVRE
eukprot:4314301-Pyramimonas_sp.AAC.1